MYVVNTFLKSILNKTIILEMKPISIQFYSTALIRHYCGLLELGIYCEARGSEHKPLIENLNLSLIALNYGKFNKQIKIKTINWVPFYLVENLNQRKITQSQ